jgi:phosphoglycolate phosphatase
MKNESMTYDAVIFDIDGTLWNASSANAKGWNVGLEELGMHQRVTAKQIESVSGNTYERCIDLLLPGLRTERPELVEVLIHRETTVISEEGGKFYEGVIDGINQLACDYRVFLVSNCPEWYLNLFLGFSRLAPVLSGVDCYGKSGLSKDQMLAKMKLHYSLKNPLYVGDTAVDEKAAALAGIAFVHAAWGFGKPEGEAAFAHSFHGLLSHIAGKTDKSVSN